MPARRSSTTTTPTSVVEPVAARTPRTRRVATPAPAPAPESVEVPNARRNRVTAEEQATMRARSQSLAAGGTLVAAQDRNADPENTGRVGMRQLLTPTAGKAGRQANIVAALVSSGMVTAEGVKAEGWEVEEQPDIITPKEAELLRLAARGYSYTEMQQHTGLNMGTVKKRIGTIYKERFGVHTMPEAVVAAIRAGVLSLSDVGIDA